MSRLVPTDEPETKLSTLNPLFLQSVLDEAAKRQKAGPTEQQTANPSSAFAINEPKAESDSSDQEQPDSFGLDLPETVDTRLPPIVNTVELRDTVVGAGHARDQHGQTGINRGHGPLLQMPGHSPQVRRNSTALPTDENPNPSSNLAYAKTILADKRAEIDQAQQQLDRLLKIKAIVEPAVLPATGKVNLNELKLKRLAIQMALVADSTEYTAQDLQAVDKQITELSGASSRQPKSPANTTERMKLNANIEELQDKVQVLTEELNRQVADYNLSVAFKKAGAYVQQLKAACNLRHELLALVELLANDNILMDLRLGGELPMPYGFEPFDSIPEDGLETTLEGIEEAKIRISQEIIL